MENYDYLLSLVLFVITCLFFFRYEKRGVIADAEFQQLPSIGQLRNLTSRAVKNHYVLLFLIPVLFFLLGLITLFYQIQQYSRYGLVEEARGVIFSNPFSGKTLQEIALRLYYDLPSAFSFFRFFSYFNPLVVFILPLFVMKKTRAEKSGKYLVPFLIACVLIAGVLVTLYFRDSVPGSLINILHVGLDVLQHYFTAYLYGYVVALLFALLEGGETDMKSLHIRADRALFSVFATMLLYTLLTSFETYVRRFIPAFSPGFGMSRTFLAILLRLFYLILVPRLILTGRSARREIADTGVLLMNKGMVFVKPLLVMAVINILLTYAFRIYAVSFTVPGIFLLIRRVLYFVVYFPVSLFLLNYLVSCIHLICEDGRDTSPAD